MTYGDKDGVGFAAMGQEGLWGERWMEPTEAWTVDSREPLTDKDKELKNKYKGVYQDETKYNDFGLANPNNTTAVIYHSRAATCEKTLENVHPFVRGETALIHNGIIRNHDTLKKLYSTCDSEVILNQYVDMDVTNNIEKIKEMAPTLTGSYGCAVLTIDKDKRRIMDIFRDISSLYMMHVKELDAVVYCTSQDIIKETCKQLGWTYGHSFKIKEDVLIRIDAVTGDLITTTEFKTFIPYVSQYASERSTTLGELEKAEQKLLSTPTTSLPACGPGANSANDSAYAEGVFPTADGNTLVEEKKSLSLVPPLVSQEEQELWRTSQ